ncbi:hypothetical protein BGX29_001647 [Mortierella sp. GBA35]|nr:hypothetical protein BGX23_001624 [Mortierella sp. AD031]KAF9086034.1 hypothetical protein BGX29_001647 [Mortierella sp. GBA35]KAG0197737.1 hypothetical protein BGX33_000361 [Mortierella sp. NVP41]
MTLQVLIVGMDVATMTLALMLELAGVDYLLLEKSDSVPTVAGGISLHPTVLPLLEQLSLRDDLLFFSQPLEQVLILDAAMEYITAYDWSDRRIRYGAWSRFMTRPEYCSVILEKLTESRVLFNKDIVSVKNVDCAEEEERAEGLPLMFDNRQDSMLDIDITMEKGEARGGVTVECTDGSSYSGHVLIADVESGIKQRLGDLSSFSGSGRTQQGGRRETSSPINYGLNTKGANTPAVDTSAPREVHYHVSGITEAIDPQRIPLLKEDTTQLRLVLDDRSSLSWWVATLVDHRIAWQVTQRIRLPEKRGSSADWPLEDEEAAKASVLSQMSQNMMCPLGGTMAQIAQWTSPSEISCKRWDDRTAPIRVNPNASRVQLLGEACRKVVPILGQAADESILDALSLAEALVGLPSCRLSDIRDALERYRKERTSRRESAIRESQDLDQLLNAKGAMQKAYRTVKLNYTPKCTQERRMDEKYSYRPQATFLQPVPDYGQVQPVNHHHHHYRSRRP